MRYGIWTPLPHTIRPEPRMIEAEAVARSINAGGGRDRAHDFAVDVAVIGERLGFSTTLIAERWLGPDLSAWMLAAAMAVETSTIELMVALHPGIIQPQQAAKFAASLDRISGGRAAVNIVNGWWEEEFRVFSNGGSQLGDPARYYRMREYLQVLRGLWSGETFTFAGDYYQVTYAALPLRCVQPNGPPVYAGTRTPQGMQSVAELGDCWFVNYETDFRKGAQNVDMVARDIAGMRRIAGGLGRDLRFGLSCHVICRETAREAEAEAMALEEHGKTDRISFIASKALGPGLIGTPEQIARRIRAFEQAGIDTLMLHFHPMIESMQVFAREVMPLVDSREPVAAGGSQGRLRGQASGG